MKRIVSNVPLLISRPFWGVLLTTKDSLLSVLSRAAYWCRALYYVTNGSPYAIAVTIVKAVLQTIPDFPVTLRDRTHHPFMLLGVQNVGDQHE